MAGKRPPLPLVLTGNDLIEGGTVYYAGGGWTADLAGATVAADDAAGVALEEALAAAEQSGEVVEPYLATVAIGADGSVQPTHYREKIRLTGPTFRDDFGRNQASGAI